MPAVQICLKGDPRPDRKGPCMKTKEFVPFILPSEREKRIGSYGVSVTNGAFGGGRVIGLDENAETITVHFAPFASLVGGEVRGRMECSMKFGKAPASDKPPLRVGAQEVRCLIIDEGPDSFQILYPPANEVIAEFRAAKKTPQ